MTESIQHHRAVFQKSLMQITLVQEWRALIKMRAKAKAMDHT